MGVANLPRALYNLPHRFAGYVLAAKCFTNIKLFHFTVLSSYAFLTGAAIRPFLQYATYKWPCGKPHFASKYFSASGLFCISR